MLNSQKTTADHLRFIVVILAMFIVCSCLHGPSCAHERLVLAVAFPPTGEMTLKPLILRCQLPGTMPR